MSLPLTDSNGVVLTVDNGTPVSWNAGLGYDAAGNLCTTTSLLATDTFVGGKRVNAVGALVVTDSPGGPFTYNAGWPTDPDTGATVRQTGIPSPTEPRVAGVAIGPLGGVYMTTGGVVCVPVFNTTPPVITGSGGVGTQVFFTSQGIYGGTVPITVQNVEWYLDNEPQGGGSSIEVLPAWVGKTITVRENAINACGNIDTTSNGILVIPSADQSPGFDTLITGGSGTMFSNNDQTVELALTNTARSAAFHDAAGKFYGEIHVDAENGQQVFYGGIGFDVSNGFIGSGTTFPAVFAYSYLPSPGYDVLNGVVLTPAAPWTTPIVPEGSTLGVLWDGDTQTVNFTIDGVLQDLTGAVVSGVPISDVRLCVSAPSSGPETITYTLRTTAAQLQYPLPVGYLPWASGSTTTGFSPGFNEGF